MTEIKSIKSYDQSHWNGQTVLVRVDFNVPIFDGTITSNNRILAALPTIQYLYDCGSKVVLMSHLGRPKGQIQEELRLSPVGQRLSELIQLPVLSLKDSIGNNVKDSISSSAERIILLENIRFYKEETSNDMAFAKSLSELADFYVNDAFGAAHRAHASTAGVAQFLPAFAGLLMEREIQALNQLLTQSQSPFTAIIGGAKVSSKLGVLESLLPKVDSLVIGGAMAFTFLASQGYDTGRSLVEKDYLDTAAKLIRLCQENNTQLLLPEDIVLAHSIDDDKVARVQLITHEQSFDDLMGVDIGPRSIEKLTSTLESSKTILWNGPLGVFENPIFSNGTSTVGKIVANQTQKGCLTVVGGGDSVAAVEQMGLSESFSHISTGGGASLEFIEGKVLPGIHALKQGAK